MSNPYATTQVTTAPAAGAPVVRPISWPATLLQVGLLVAAIAAGIWWLPFPELLVWAAGAFLAYSLGSKLLIARAHRRGVRLSRSGRYEEAIAAFEESYRFFTRHSWIDRYRAVTMLSAAAMSYREMALCNIAFAYSQLGMGLKARDTYRRALAEFPGSALATASLRMIEAGAGIGGLPSTG